MLHVTNGDSTVPELSRALGGAPVDPVARRAARGAGARRARRRAARAADAVPGRARRSCCASATKHWPPPRRSTLWFEADLYDQLQIVQILARLHPAARARVRLACIGEHPGIARFGGLGELYAEQLAALEPAPLTAAAFELAARRLGRLPRSRAERPRRHRRRPLAGAALPRGGVRPARPRVPLDARWAVADRAAAAGRRPRRRADAGRGVRAGRGARDAPVPGRHVGVRPARATWRRWSPEDPLQLTDAGRAVLAGEADHVTICGVDRWIGGVHLQGHDVPWRWDEGLEAVSPARAAPS